jgi:CRP-like cAMP-binding protein
MLTTIERVLFLRGVDLFAYVPDDVLARVAQVAQIVHFAPGEQFIEQGSAGDCLYVMIDGEAGILVDNQQVARRLAREVIGELAILDKHPRRATCVAITDITALKIDQNDFTALMEESPALLQGIIKVLIQTLDEAVSKASA